MKRELHGDITKPHLRRFLSTRKIGDEPQLNPTGFWPRPSFHTAKDPLSLVQERSKDRDGK